MAITNRTPVPVAAIARSYTFSFNDDVTLGWLNNSYGGITVRQRLINRLS